MKIWNIKINFFGAFFTYLIYFQKKYHFILKNILRAHWSTIVLFLKMTEHNFINNTTKIVSTKIL
jgi:hypothetical protein